MDLKVMAPFVRREEEARRVTAAMERRLKRGENRVAVFVRYECPNNVIRTDGFAFDGVQPDGALR